jgi:hypothetical protein
LVWDLGRKTAQIFQHPMDLAVRRSALGRIQFHRHAGQAPVGTPCNRHHDFKIPIEFRHRRQGRICLALPLRLQEQLRLIQKPLANRGSCTPPGGI